MKTKHPVSAVASVHNSRVLVHLIMVLKASMMGLFLGWFPIEIGFCEHTVFSSTPHDNF